MTTLFLWVAIGTYTLSSTGYWEKLETYTEATYCHAAAKSLGIDPKQYRCIGFNGEIK